MGRRYVPVEVSLNGKKTTTVAFIDTGADETIISEKLAGEINAKLYGNYRATCASGFLVIGKYALLNIKELKHGKQAEIEVGVSDIPFSTDEVDEEDLGVIIGNDFIQEVNLKIN